MDGCLGERKAYPVLSLQQLHDNPESYRYLPWDKYLRLGRDIGLERSWVHVVLMNL